MSGTSTKPWLTISNLLIDLRKLFNLYLEFDIRRQSCTMDFGDDVLASDEVVDWTDRARPDHMKIPELANRLELSYALDGNDALLKPVPATMDKYTTLETAANAGGTLVPIQSRLSTLLTDSATGRAVIRQPGRSTTKTTRTGNLEAIVLERTGERGATGQQRLGEPEPAVVRPLQPGGCWLSSVWGLQGGYLLDD